MDFRCKIFPLNYSSPQTVESSAREFLGNDNSSVLTSTVVWIINYRLVIQLILAEKKTNNYSHLVMTLLLILPV